MTPASGGRLLAVSVLLAATVLGGTYALGRSLGDDRTESDNIAVTTTREIPAGERPGNRSRRPDVSTSQRADRVGVPPDPVDVPAPSTAPKPPAAPGSGQPDSPARTGPYGSRHTTGTTDVALTFDDGPDPRYTPQVLALLRRYQVKATFCLVGENARDYPYLVQAIVAEGHTLCNHSWAHDLALGGRARSAILTDLARTNEAIRAAVPDAHIPYFRQPGGNWTASVVAVARELGQNSLHWTVDPRDWTQPGPGNIAASVSAGTFPGAIVLLHDAGGERQGTVTALGGILPNLTARFRLVPLSPEVGSDQPRA